VRTRIHTTPEPHRKNCQKLGPSEKQMKNLERSSSSKGETFHLSPNASWRSSRVTSKPCCLAAARIASVAPATLFRKGSSVSSCFKKSWAASFDISSSSLPSWRIPGSRNGGTYSLSHVICIETHAKPLRTG